MELHVLTSLEQLDSVLAAAASRPVYLFKHSETCGMSLQAYEEVRELVDDPAVDTAVYLVSVHASRPVTTAIATRFGVRHQSPQVLLVDGAHVLWHTSHLAITADAMREAVARAAVGV